jgi:hypothetical protein
LRAPQQRTTAEQAGAIGCASEPKLLRPVEETSLNLVDAGDRKLAHGRVQE